MNRKGFAASLVTAVVICLPPSPTGSQSSGAPVETRVPAGSAQLFARAVGTGPAVLVLHGGPDFDHGYLLPDLDRFRDTFRLIYYDQRGRGQSADGVAAEDVTLASDIEDVDRVRQHFGLERSVVLGHSWGTVLALEYALRYPDRVSHLVLMNPAPASTADVSLLRTSYLQKLGPAMEQQRAIVATPAYKEGDPETVAARYRIHFKVALTRADDYEKLMTVMKAGFVKQGRSGILKARAVEDRLMAGSWQQEGYDLLPKLGSVRIPTLIIAGEDDFIPVEVAQRVAAALSASRLVTIKDCGHFAYLECAAQTRTAIVGFFAR